MTKKERLRKKKFALLLRKFSDKLLKKLLANERKYRFGDGWRSPNWRAQLQAGLLSHVAKGDPRDVAIYALFADFHGWPTAEPAAPAKVNITPYRELKDNYVGAPGSAERTEFDEDVAKELGIESRLEKRYGKPNGKRDWCAESREYERGE